MKIWRKKITNGLAPLLRNGQLMIELSFCSFSPLNGSDVLIAATVTATATVVYVLSLFVSSFLRWLETMRLCLGAKLYWRRFVADDVDDDIISTSCVLHIRADNAILIQQTPLKATSQQPTHSAPGHALYVIDVIPILDTSTATYSEINTPILTFSRALHIDTFRHSAYNRYKVYCVNIIHMRLRVVPFSFPSWNSNEEKRHLSIVRLRDTTTRPVPFEWMDIVFLSNCIYLSDFCLAYSRVSKHLIFHRNTRQSRMAANARTSVLAITSCSFCYKNWASVRSQNVTHWWAFATHTHTLHFLLHSATAQLPCTRTARKQKQRQVLLVLLVLLLLLPFASHSYTQNGANK